MTVRCGVNLKNYDAYALNPDRSNSTSPAKSDPEIAGSEFPLDAPASLREKFLRLAILVLALLCLAATRARACGPNFPNSLLGAGDAALLRAPVARFRAELERMQLVTGRFAAKPATNGFDEQARDAELADLAAALKLAHASAEESDRICAAHRAQREKLNQFLAEFDVWAGATQFIQDENGGHTLPPEGPAPKFGGVAAVLGLPAEFADYLEGAVVWRNPGITDKAAAREAWERLLARPEAERKYKSTWAAYMLGRFFDDEATDKAIQYYQQVRELARKGFVDSTGLAVASLGWEARLLFHDHKYREAMTLYLEQLAAGDESAVISLQWVANAALAESAVLPEIARDENAQKVLTAFLVSSEDLAWVNHPSETETPSELAANWLRAVEAAGVTDVDSSEKLALAAYQSGDFETAQRWINRASNSTVAQWLQAKLHFRAGKVKQGAALLAKVTARLPIQTDNAADRVSELADNLYLTLDDDGYSVATAREQALAELGVLRLSRREFTTALDALLRSGYWSDAAYVAERVLTVDELKDYVDHDWPFLPPKAKVISTNEEEIVRPPIEEQSENIRYLLGRRLTRELRGSEARAYYPRDWQPQFDRLVDRLVAGWNDALPIPERARALYEAAWITRTNGMELVGTELGPDYHIWLGDFEHGVDWEIRAANEQRAKLNVATTNEIQRAREHTAAPDLRFHYRYQAAFMAGRAARMLPDNSDETALILCTAGSWLKDRDPETANIFYKSLVQRCRKTALGAEADRRHWFPRLDANGGFVPREPAPIAHIEFSLTDDPPTAETEADAGAASTSAAPTFRGLSYVVVPGDTLMAIVTALRQSGVMITIADVLTANPGLEPTKMAVGSSLTIPLEPLPSLQPEAEPN